MLETVLGSLMGGIFRIVPEIMKWLDRKDERAHELAMFDKQIEADKLRSEEHLAEIQAQGSITLDAAGLEALKEAIKSQGQAPVLSGIKWVDIIAEFIFAVTQSVRPFVTYLILWLYIGAKVSTMYVLYDGGTSIAEVLRNSYGDADMALLSGILNFWFMSRVFEKYGNDRRVN